MNGNVITMLRQRLRVDLGHLIKDVSGVTLERPSIAIKSLPQVNSQHFFSKADVHQSVTNSRLVGVPSSDVSAFYCPR